MLGWTFGCFGFGESHPSNNKDTDKDQIKDKDKIIQKNVELDFGFVWICGESQQQ